MNFILHLVWRNLYARCLCISWFRNRWLSVFCGRSKIFIIYCLFSVFTSTHWGW